MLLCLWVLYFDKSSTPLPTPSVENKGNNGKQLTNFPENILARLTAKNVLQICFLLQKDAKDFYCKPHTHTYIHVIHPSNT